MRSFIQEDHVLTLTAPTGGVTVDVPVRIGGVFVLPVESAAVGDPFEGWRRGVFNLARASGGGTAWAEGQPLYWDQANKLVSGDPNAGEFIGTAHLATADGDAKGKVVLNGGFNLKGVFQARVRVAIADVNAGATLIPAVPGLKLRLVDAIMIAVGGAVGACDTVDILATQAAGSVKLVAAAQAGLTQSAVVRAGDAVGAVLADGASFAANDVGTAITCDQTGAAATVATHVDFILTYALDA